MKIIIIIEQNTQDFHQYTVRARVDASSVVHTNIGDFFQTAEDAHEFAEAFSAGAVLAGAETLVAASHEIAHELEYLPEYLRDFRSYNFERVWEII